MTTCIEKGGILAWLFEKISRKDELWELSTLKRVVTGLPVNIWVDDTGAYIRGRYAKRIRFQGDYENNTNRANLFSMILSKDNPQIPAKQLRKLQLSAEDIDAIKTFVKNNFDFLDQLADEEIAFTTFIRQMKV
jgi:hypothetical protein